MILKNKIAVVTGAGSGIGRGSAEILAREGATVIVSDRDLCRANATVEQIKTCGGSAHSRETDVGIDEQLQSLISGTLSDFGRIDILHSNVGTQVAGTAEQVDPDGMEKSWQLNVRSHFLAARFVMASMKKQGGGSIVFTASNSGVLYDREMIAYATTKHAVVAMAKQMALDYARYNIRINTLCPGWVDTPFNDPFMQQMGGRDSLEEYIQNQIPMGRWAAAAEIAEGLLFLASDRSSFMTGQALVIDGGECLS